MPNWASTKLPRYSWTARYIHLKQKNWTQEAEMSFKTIQTFLLRKNFFRGLKRNSNHYSRFFFSYGLVTMVLTFINGRALRENKLDGRRYRMASYTPKQCCPTIWATPPKEVQYLRTSISFCENVSASSPIMLARCRRPISKSWCCCFMNISKIQII